MHTKLTPGRPTPRWALVLVTFFASISASIARAEFYDWVDLPDQRLVLRGTINGRLNVLVDVSIMDNQVTGQYCYTNRGLPLYFLGELSYENGDTVLSLTEYETNPRGQRRQDLTPTGVWTLTQSEDDLRWTGRWMSPDTSRSFEVELTRVAQYELFARTVPNISAEVQTPCFEGIRPELIAAVNAVGEESIGQANAFIAEWRAAAAAPDWRESNPILSQYYELYDWRVDHVGDNIVSMHMLYYFYTGGAHSNYGYSVRSFYVNNGEAHELGPDEIFRPGDAWVPALRARFVEGLQQARAEWIPAPEDREANEFLSEEALSYFTVAPHGLTYYIGPYTFGPYAQGTITVRIPWSAIAEHVDPDGPVGIWVE